VVLENYTHHASFACGGDFYLTTGIQLANSISRFIVFNYTRCAYAAQMITRIDYYTETFSFLRFRNSDCHNL